MAVDLSKLSVIVETEDRASATFRQLESSIIRFVGAVSSALSAIAVIGFPIKAAADFQTQLLEAAKTTGFTADETQRLANGLVDLSRKLNISAVDLAKVAAIGGQLGFDSEKGVKALLAFADTASRMASTLNISVDDAANGIGVLQNVFKVAETDIERISSALTKAATSSTASGAELLDIVKRIGTAGGTLGLKQSIALGALGKDLGLTVETVGTSFNKIFLDLQTKSAEIAPLVGVPVEEWSRSIVAGGTRGIEALKQYLRALLTLAPATRAAVAEQTTGGGRIFALITALLGDAKNNFVLMDTLLNDVNDAFERGTVAQEQQKTVLQGLQAQYQILKNVIFDLAEAIGRQALPFLTQLAKKFQELAQDPVVVQRITEAAKAFAEWTLKGIELIASLTGVIGGLGPLVQLLKAFAVIKVAGAIGSVITSLGRQTVAIGTTAVAWKGLLTLQRDTVNTLATGALAAQQALNGTAQAAANTNRAISKNAAPTNLGRAAIVAQGVAAPLFQAQDAAALAAERTVTAENLVNSAIARRQVLLANIDGRLTSIMNNERAQIAAATQNVTIAAERLAIERQIEVANTRAVTRLTIARAAADASLTNAITRRQQTLAAAQTQAASAQLATQGLSRVSLVAQGAGVALAGLFAGVTKLAAGFGLLLRFVIPASVALLTVAAILEAFGVLDPVLRFFKDLLGITDDSTESAERAAQAQAAAFEKEKQSAADLAKQYDKTREAREKLFEATSKPVTDFSAIDANVREAIRQVEVTTGKSKDLAISVAEADRLSENLATKFRDVSLQAALAEQNVTALKGAAKEAATSAGSIAVSAQPITTPALKEAIADSEKLRKESVTLGEALDLARQKAQAIRAEQDRVSTDMVKSAAALSGFYQKQTFELLTMFESVVVARKKQADAEQAMADNASLKKGTADQVAEFQKLVVELERAKIGTQQFELQFKAALAAAPPDVTEFFFATVPDQATAALETVKAVLDAMATATGTGVARIDEQLSTLGDSFSKVQTEIAKVQEQRDAAIRASGGKDIGKVTASFDVSIAKFREQAVQLQSQIDLLGRLKVAANFSIAPNADDDVRRLGIQQSAYDNLAKKIAQASLIAKALIPAKDIADSAKATADFIKDRFEGSAKGVAAAFRNAFELTAETMRIVARRGTDAALAEFDRLAARRAETQNLSLDKDEKTRKTRQDLQVQQDLDRFRETLTAQGASENEITAALQKRKVVLDLVTAQEDADAGIARKRADEHRQDLENENRAALELRNIKALLVKDEEAISAAATKRIGITDAIDKAKVSGDSVELRRLAEQLSNVGQNAADAAKDYADNIKKISELGSRPLATGIDDKFRFLITPEEIANLSKRAGQLGIDAANVNRKIQDSANAAATQGAATESAAVEGLQGQLKDINKEIAEQVARWGEAGKTFESLISLLNKTGELEKLGSTFTKAADTNLTGTPLFTSVKQLDDMLKAAVENAGKLTTAFTQGTTGTVNTPVADRVKQFTEEAQKNGIDINDIKFPNLKEKLQASAKTAGPIEILISPKFVPSTDTAPSSQPLGTLFVEGAGGALTKLQTFAGGGLVNGPGTTTSDSIPAWLSRREYVMDAMTTSFFGSGFFRTLQLIAKGRGPSFMSAKGLIPKFAGGGPVAGAVAGLGSLSEFGTPMVLNFPGYGGFEVRGTKRSAQGLEAVCAQLAARKGVRSTS